MSFLPAIATNLCLLAQEDKEKKNTDFNLFPTGCPARVVIFQGTVSFAH